MTRDDGQSSTRQIGPIAVLLSLVYGVLAAYIFCFSGSFGRLGEYWWFDIALITITITASLSLAYVSLLLISYVRQKAVDPGDPTDFTWHFLIPCRDEESVIAETVSAARTSFPEAHIWVIDDASEDATAAIVTDIMDVDDRTHLISRVLPEARTGKGKALNAAYRSVSGFVGADPADRARAVIGVLDADGFLSDNALSVLSGPAGFGDETLGAAQLEVWMKNRGDKRPRPGRNWFLNLLGRFLIRMQDIEFRTSNSAMQQLRVTTGTVGMGGNGQFTRLTVLDALTEDHGEPWGNKLSEDYELGLNILTRGFRNGYFPQAHVSQEALPHFRRLLTQRTRWGQGIMECASNLPALRRSRVLRFPGFVEIHYFMSQPWLMMLNLLLIPIVTAVAIAQGFFGFVSDAATWIIVLTGLVFVVLPYALWGPLYRRWGPEPIGRTASVLLGLGYLVYVYFTYFYYPRAIARMVTGRRRARHLDLHPGGTASRSAARPEQPHRTRRGARRQGRVRRGDRVPVRPHLAAPSGESAAGRGRRGRAGHQRCDRQHPGVVDDGRSTPTAGGCRRLHNLGREPRVRCRTCCTAAIVPGRRRHDRRDPLPFPRSADPRSALRSGLRCPPAPSH